MLYFIAAIIIFFNTEFLIASRGNSNSKSKSHENGNEAINETTSCENSCTDGVIIPNFCDYASYQWDDPSISIDERNNIGRASLLSSTNILKAKSLISKGKVYKLSYEYTNTIPAYGTRTWYTSLRMPDAAIGDVPSYYEFASNDSQQCGAGLGYLDQRLYTSANGNSGTQFDGNGHVFYMNGDYGDMKNYLFHNGFTGDQIMKEYGLKFIGIEQLPPFVTRAILLDVADYVGDDPLPGDYKINSTVIENTLINQGMHLNDIDEGDVILVYTGWANANWYNGDSSVYYSKAPGLTLDTIINIFGPKGVVILGSDNFGVEFDPIGLSVHAHWIVCNGGFLYENLKLIEWVTDVRNGTAPYMGMFAFTPTQIEGGVGGLGTPMIII